MVFAGYAGRGPVATAAAATAAQLFGAMAAVPVPVPVPLVRSNSSRTIYRTSIAVGGPGFMAGAEAMATSVAVIAGWPFSIVLVYALDLRGRV